MSSRIPQLPTGKQLDALRAAVEREPEAADAHYRLGTALLRRGLARDAEASLRRAVELDPEHVRAWVNLGGLLLLGWDFAGCVEVNRRASACDPDSVQAHFNEGLGHLYLGQAEEMVACFTRVLELDPGSAAGEHYLGVGLLALDRLAEAQHWLASAQTKGHAPQPQLIREIERKMGGQPTTIELGSDEGKPTAS